MKEYLWEQADGSVLKVVVDHNKGTVVARDKEGNVKMREEDLSKEQLDLIEKQFLEIVVNYPERSKELVEDFDPMFM